MTLLWLFWHTTRWVLSFFLNSAICRVHSLLYLSHAPSLCLYLSLSLCLSLSLSLSLSRYIYIYIYINAIKDPHPIPVYKIANNCSLVYWQISQCTGLNDHNDFVSIYSLWTSVSAITYLRCMFLQLGLNLEYIIEHRCHQHQIYIYDWKPCFE